MNPVHAKLIGTGHDVRLGAKVVELGDAEYGSLDGEKLGRVRRLLLDLASEPRPQPLVVDLSKVHFFGAGFIGVLVDTWDQLKNHNRRLVLCGLRPLCARLARTLHLDKLFDIFRTRALALEMMANHLQPGPEDGKTAPLRIRQSEVAWDPSMVRLELIGDDDIPARSVIVPRLDGDGPLGQERDQVHYSVNK